MDKLNRVVMINSRRIHKTDSYDTKFNTLKQACLILVVLGLSRGRKFWTQELTISKIIDMTR